MKERRIFRRSIWIFLSMYLFCCCNVQKNLQKKYTLHMLFECNVVCVSTCLTPVSAEALTAETLEASHSVATRCAIEALVTVD